jgi:DNA-directed RNA polymerase specialized sigma24 family protein
MDLAERLNEIHLRMLDGSRTASRDLFVAALYPLRGFLASHFNTLAEDDLHDLATDAIVIYATAPEQCDIAKSSLWTYLCMIARADAIDRVKKNANRERLLDKKLETDVEFWAARAKDVFRGEDAVDARHIIRLYGNRLVTNPIEANVLALILNDEKDTAEFAAALGLDPAASDIEKCVKKAKDRMLVRIKRLRHEI